MEYDLEYMQEQIYALKNETDELRMEMSLLRQEVNRIKSEGCWRFYENSDHEHKK